MFLLLVLAALLKVLLPGYVVLVTLQMMQFHMRTGYGDPTTKYGGCHTLSRWMELGQGSSGAPAGWLQVSSPIFNILEKAGYGAEIEHPITHEKTKSVGAAFVDDTNMYVFGSHPDSEVKVEKEADDHVTAWVTFLRVIGCCAKSAKSFW